MPPGLTTDAARSYLRLHGYNEIIEKKPSAFRKAAGRFASPISLMLLAAAALSYAGGKWFDGAFILALLVANVAVALWQEHKADAAIEKLNGHLATQAKVLRDGTWQRIPSRELAPRDIVELHAGDIVPADAKIVRANAATFNEASLTGESLPVEKGEGGAMYAGSFLSSGIVRAEVSATGNATYFGKTLARVEAAPKRSALEQEILQIARLLSAVSLLAVVLLTGFLVARGAPLAEIIRLDLSLLIAGVPVSLPTVMTLIIAFGVLALSRAGAIVRRLSALQELADTDYLLTDKTGTLTLNRITVDAVVPHGEFSEGDILSLAGVVAAQQEDEPINRAIVSRVPASREAAVVSYTPGDSSRKRATAVIREDGAEMTLALGAPQVIAGLCPLSDGERAAFEAEVGRLAERGYRALALARVEGREERGMTLCGLLSLSDTLREDARGVVEFLGENGVGVAMVTGDNRAIAGEIARKLALPGTTILTPAEKPAGGWASLSREAFERAQAFAEILPEDKYELVRSAKRFHVVAANGDGINDLPAIREANVSFAVRNAVDALKSAADIVLTTDGIAVMRDAFLEGRKIFMRLYAYAVYRIAESFRLIITIAILGFLAGAYPLSPLQLILIALLNDIPIISLAGNRVRVARKPSRLDVGAQFASSILFGLVGVVNSLLLYAIALHVWHLPFAVVQTMFFLKLTVSGHLLLYVAHTKERWWHFLPSGTVIAATSLTQFAATALALSGFLMPAPLSLPLVLFVWGWAFLFMQVAELTKLARERYDIGRRVALRLRAKKDKVSVEHRSELALDSHRKGNTMCDYSLRHKASRPAVQGETLVTTRFSDASTRGLASAGDPNTAVCVLPGTELAFADPVSIERTLPRDADVGGETKRIGIPPKAGSRVATFVQVDKSNPYLHHDAFEFSDGAIVLLTDLAPGQTVIVLELPADTETMTGKEREAAENDQSRAAFV